jgi:hypothetical protein
MAILRSLCACLCSLVIVAAIFPGRAAAEAVQISPTVDANTVALWRFREGTGTTSANDVTGKPAVTVGSATWVPGRQYYALATDTGYAQVADDASTRPRTAITVEIWVKLQRNMGDLISKNGIYQMRLGRNGIIAAPFTVDGTSCEVDGVVAVPTGQWTHLAITYQQNSATTGTGAIYINGVLDTTKQFTGLTTGLLSAGYGAKLLIGNNDWTTMGSEMDGKIDSLRISNIARVFDPLYPTPPAPATSKGNLVPNGDFEIGLTGWRGDAYGDINLIWETTGGAASGQNCLHSILGSTPQAGLYSRPFPAHPGRRYTMSGRFKVSSGTYNVRFEILGLGSGTGDVTVVTQWPTLSTSWLQKTYSFTLPYNFAPPSLAVHIGYPVSATGSLYVDDVRVMASDGTTTPTLKDKIAVGPQTLPVGNLYTYTPSATTATTLIITNTDTVAHDVTVQPTIADWEENQVSGVPSLGTFSVPANSAITTSYGMDTGRRGTFRLGFDLTSEGQTWRQGAESKYAVVVNMQNVGNADTSIFGMNVHLDREPTPHILRELQVLSMCGVKWIRAWWGWGMCEKTQNSYDWTEYDRQFNAITSGAGMRVMPILLRYSAALEQSWAGSLATQQQPPFPTMMDQWGLFCGKVAQHFQGQITAYELWNEPGTDNNHAINTAIYTQLLTETAPNTRKPENDPNAKIIGFAGVALTRDTKNPTYVNMTDVLANNTAQYVDAVSEHPYSQTLLPEKNYPVEMASVRAIMTTGGCPTNMPIWHTEQGIHADGDGFKVKTLSEADVAQLYTRNVITAASQGSQRFFWFSSDDTPEYGYTVFYGDYVPRARLAALAACASFIEDTTFQKTYKPDGNTMAHMFQGTTTGVCAFWNTITPMQFTLAISPSKLQAFDTMGNAIPITGATTSTIQVAAERPTFLQCAIADYSALDTAVSGAQVANVSTVNIAMTPIVGAVRVTLTGASPLPVDGIVDLIAAASATPKGWPAAQHFQSLGLGQSQSFTFVVPAKAGIGQVRVRCGDRRILETKVAYKAH